MEANDWSDELCIKDIVEPGFSQRLADDEDDDVVDDAEEASALFGGDWVWFDGCQSSDSLLAVWLLALWYCVLIEAAGLCGDQRECLDQTSLLLALVEVNVLLLGSSLMVFSSEMRELAKSSEVEFV